MFLSRLLACYSDFIWCVKMTQDKYSPETLQAIHNCCIAFKKGLRKSNQDRRSKAS